MVKLLWFLKTSPYRLNNLWESGRIKFFPWLLITFHMPVWCCDPYIVCNFERFFWECSAHDLDIRTFCVSWINGDATHKTIKWCRGISVSKSHNTGFSLYKTCAIKAFDGKLLRSRERKIYCRRLYLWTGKENCWAFGRLFLDLMAQYIAYYTTYLIIRFGRKSWNLQGFIYLFFFLQGLTEACKVSDVFEWTES
jgi:hypothetical protein